MQGFSLYVLLFKFMWMIEFEVSWALQDQQYVIVEIVMTRITINFFFQNKYVRISFLLSLFDRSFCDWSRMSHKWFCFLIGPMGPTVDQPPTEYDQILLT